MLEQSPHLALALRSGHRRCDFSPEQHGTKHARRLAFPPPVGSRYQPEFATAAEIRDLTKQAVDFGAFARVQLQKAHYGSGESTRTLLRWERLECTKRITSCPIEADLLQGQAKKFIHGFNAEHLNLGGGKELKSVHMSSQSTCGHAFPHQQAF